MVGSYRSYYFQRNEHQEYRSKRWDFQKCESPVGMEVCSAIVKSYCFAHSRGM